MNKINYLFDPLCGWCYAVSPAVQKLAQTHEIVLMPTGLFSQPREMDAAWAQHAWENDQKIQQITGLEFSQRYYEHIL